MRKVIVRATKLNNKNVYVLQIGTSLCYKLGQTLLQIGGSVIITNWGKCCYKLRQLLGLPAITN